MKLVTYLTAQKTACLGLALPGGGLVDLERALDWGEPGEGFIDAGVPATMIELLARGPQTLAGLRALADRLAVQPASALAGLLLPATTALLAPLPRPNNVRDFYAFEQHVKTARALRGAEMIPEWYQIPVFYFSNPDAIYGPDAPVPVPQETAELDYELELACVIGRAGRDIPAEQCAGLRGGLYDHERLERARCATAGNEDEPRPGQRQRFRHQSGAMAGHARRVGGPPRGELEPTRATALIWWRVSTAKSIAEAMPLHADAHLLPR